MNIKSPQAFRTISEVSKDLSLPQHVLRFWETKFAQIKPIKRPLSLCLFIMRKESNHLILEKDG